MGDATGLRIGVVGYGYWGPKHLRVLGGLDGVAAVAVVEARAERIVALTRSSPDVRCYTALHDALSGLDAVVVATPPTTHVPIALEALAAGKHVLVEKPLANSVTGAHELIAAASQAGVVLMVGHTFEYNPAVRALRALIRSGELGQLYYLDSARLNLGLYQSDVNVIADLAPHDISIMNYVLGRQPVAVQAWASRHAHRSLEDVAYLRLYYEDDDQFSANIHVSWLDPCKVRRVTAVGSRKMAVYNDLAAEERIRVFDKGVVAPLPEGDLAQPPMQYRYGEIRSPYVEFEEPLLLQDRHFVDSVLSGGVPLTDGLNGLAVVEVLECLQRSQAQGRRVAIEEVRSVPLPRPATIPPSRVLSGLTANRE